MAAEAFVQTTDPDQGQGIVAELAAKLGPRTLMSRMPGPVSVGGQDFGGVHLQEIVPEDIRGTPGYALLVSTTDRKILKIYCTGAGTVRVKDAVTNQGDETFDVKRRLVIGAPLNCSNRVEPARIDEIVVLIPAQAIKERTCGSTAILAKYRHARKYGAKQRLGCVDVKGYPPPEYVTLGIACSQQHYSKLEEHVPVKDALLAGHAVTLHTASGRIYEAFLSKTDEGVIYNLCSTDGVNDFTRKLERSTDISDAEIGRQFNAPGGHTSEIVSACITENKRRVSERYSCKTQQFKLAEKLVDTSQVILETESGAKYVLFMKGGVLTVVSNRHLGSPMIQRVNGDEAIERFLGSIEIGKVYIRPDGEATTPIKKAYVVFNAVPDADEEDIRLLTNGAAESISLLPPATTA